LVHPVTAKFVVFGSKGFIGRHFCCAFPEALGVDRRDLDLCNPRLSISLEGYHYALIAAGIADPKKCIEYPIQSYACNVRGTLQLGKELLKRGILPILLSSDYVLNDELEVAPLNLYGEQKWELEQEGVAMDALVIRLSKVYGIEKGDRTLFDAMAHDLVRGKSIKAAYDQIFAPIYIGDLIKRLLFLLEQKFRGLISITGPTFASRLEMAEFLADKLGVSPSLIQKISLDDLQDGIRRPKRLTVTSDFPALCWQEGVEKMVASYAR
jgi:dTDP-4-dehydrorhamnose reductase